MLSQSNNFFMVAEYVAYLLITVSLTIWVARTLQKNGTAFLHETFLGKDNLAESVNHLLVVGFYLINIGYVALNLRDSAEPHTYQGVIEAVCAKVGVVMLVLGAMHFFNLYVFNRIRKSGELKNAPRPVPPREFTKVMDARPIPQGA